MRAEKFEFKLEPPEILKLKKKLQEETHPLIRQIIKDRIEEIREGWKNE